MNFLSLKDSKLEVLIPKFKELSEDKANDGLITTLAGLFGAFLFKTKGKMKQ